MNKTLSRKKWTEEFVKRLGPKCDVWNTDLQIYYVDPYEIRLFFLEGMIFSYARIIGNPTSKVSGDYHRFWEWRPNADIEGFSETFNFRTLTQRDYLLLLQLCKETKQWIEEGWEIKNGY